MDDALAPPQKWRSPVPGLSSDARRGCGVDPISCLGDAARRAQESWKP